MTPSQLLMETVRAVLGNQSVEEYEDIVSLQTKKGNAFKEKENLEERIGKQENEVEILQFDKQRVEEKLRQEEYVS